MQVQRRKTGREKGFDYDAFTDDQLSDVWQYNLFPNVILSFTPGHLWLMRVRPDAVDPGKCLFDKYSFVLFADPQMATTPSETDRAAPSPAPQDAQASLSVRQTRRTHIGVTATKPADYVRPQRDVFDYSAVVAGEKTMTDTIDQDVELLGNVQAGMSSAAFDTTWLNDDEMRVQHFHNEVDRRLRG